MKYVLFLGLVVLAACGTKTNTTVVKITNETEVVLQDVHVEPAGGPVGELVTIQPDQTVSYSVDLSEAPPGDGRYLLNYTLNGEQAVHGFGYYTNGRALEPLHRVKITPDGAFTEPL